MRGHSPHKHSAWVSASPTALPDCDIPLVSHLKARGRRNDGITLIWTQKSQIRQVATGLILNIN